MTKGNNEQAVFGQQQKSETPVATKKKKKKKTKRKGRRRTKWKPASCTSMVIPRCVIHRLARELVQDRRCDFRVTEGATDVLHTEVERYLHKFFGSCAEVARSSGRETITSHDISVVQNIRSWGGGRPWG